MCRKVSVLRFFIFCVFRRKGLGPLKCGFLGKLGGRAVAEKKRSIPWFWTSER